MFKNEAFGIDKHLKVCNSSYWGSCKEWVTVHCWLTTKQHSSYAGQLRSVYQKYKCKKKKKCTNAFWLSNPNPKSFLSNTPVLVGNNICISLFFASLFVIEKRWETTYIEDTGEINHGWSTQLYILWL